MTELPETQLLVIGGGSTGAGVAWDAARRGLHVTLVDRGDLATGTTGRFHGLLHSGGRYAVKDPGSARECAGENVILRRIAAGCIEDTGGLFVTTPADDPGYADRFLAGAAVAGMPVEEIPVAEALRREPLLNPRISRAIAVQDGSIDCWKTVWACVRGARAYGAQILPYHEVLSIRLEQGAVVGASLRDNVSGAVVEIRAQCILNAAGPWTGRIAKMAGCALGVIPGKGVMVAMNHRLVNTVINRCNMPGDGDIIVPAHTVCVIGTTDVPVDDPDQIAPTAAEVAKMMAAGEVLVPGFSRARALRAWAGARPLIPKGAAPAGEVRDTREVTRSHSVVKHAGVDGVEHFITITGGKFTTFRLMAEDAVDAVCADLKVSARCSTAEAPLPDSEDQRFFSLGSHQKEMEEHVGDDPLICECELVTRGALRSAASGRPGQQLDDLRRSLRLGMGPCQGGFCSFRAAGLLHHEGYYDRSQTNDALAAFVEERWRGQRMVLWGQQLRQYRLDSWIFQGILDLEHLPA